MKLTTLPFALPSSFVDQIQKNPSLASQDFWFIFKGSTLLIDKDSGLPFQPKGLSLIRSVYMGVFREAHIHVGEIAFAPPHALCVDLKILYGQIDDELYALSGRAFQLLLWDRTHQFCGECGRKTRDRPIERAKECPACQLLSFPKISPAIMALVEREDTILLARSPHFPKGVYSVLAGFVDPGETLEQCVRREVLEEVGISVSTIEYFGSQPWPFPHSLMIAFTCKWQSGEIKIDPQEIEDAQWFKKDQLPPLPSNISLSRAVIDAVISSH